MSVEELTKATFVFSNHVFFKTLKQTGNVFYTISFDDYSYLKIYELLTCHLGINLNGVSCLRENFFAM